MGLLLLGATLLLGQRSPQASSQLRAVALLELASDGRAHLVPVAIKVADKYYDAGVYRADPYPMALGRDTVYEAERAGESVGLFTVTGVQKVKDFWVGAGQWRANNTLQSAEKSSKTERPRAEADQRPVLRRSKPAADETKPVTPDVSQPKPGATSADGTSPGAAVSPTSPPAASDNDSDRPLLRRGKPATPPTSGDFPSALNTAPVNRAASHAIPSGPAVEVLAAVSDASGPAPHSYALSLKQEERDRDEHSMRQMAYEAIRKFAAVRPQHKPAEAARLENVRFQAYDALNNHEPDLVLTASLPELPPLGAASGFRYFVTAVARIDMYGVTRLLSAQVTDSTHLDAYPRMEFIDIVDAEGSGTGQLLFRRVSDTGYSFALYRIGLDKLWPLFEGAERTF